jgi:hypothetical protein
MTDTNKTEQETRIGLSDLTVKLGGELREWQPIETAPKKGCRVDLWLGDRRWTGCYWDSICEEWRKTTETLILLKVPRRSATHWMPEPKPPNVCYTPKVTHNLESKT